MFDSCYQSRMINHIIGKCGFENLATVTTVNEIMMKPYGPQIGAEHGGSLLFICLLGEEELAWQVPTKCIRHFENVVKTQPITFSIDERTSKHMGQSEDNNEGPQRELEKLDTMRHTLERKSLGNWKSTQNLGLAYGSSSFHEEIQQSKHLKRAATPILMGTQKRVNSKTNGDIWFLYVCLYICPDICSPMEKIKKISNP